MVEIQNDLTKVGAKYAEPTLYILNPGPKPELAAHDLYTWHCCLWNSVSCLPIKTTCNRLPLNATIASAAGPAK